MKIRNKSKLAASKLDLTSMIDVVFLLLIFFVMTFKIVEQEGDFSVKMPLAGAAGAATDDTELPLKLRMKADQNGRLTSMAMNEIQLGTDFNALRNTVVGLVGNAQPSGAEGEGPEVEIDTDYNLRYEYVIQGITSVSGYKSGNDVVKLIEKIKFAKPRR